MPHKSTWARIIYFSKAHDPSSDVISFFVWKSYNKFSRKIYAEILHDATVADDSRLTSILCQEDRIGQCMQIVSKGDNFHVLSNPVFKENYLRQTKFYFDYPDEWPTFKENVGSTTYFLS